MASNLLAMASKHQIQRMTMTPWIQRGVTLHSLAQVHQRSGTLNTPQGRLVQKNLKVGMVWVFVGRNGLPSFCWLQ